MNEKISLDPAAQEDTIVVLGEEQTLLRSSLRMEFSDPEGLDDLLSFLKACNIYLELSPEKAVFSRM